MSYQQSLNTQLARPLEWATATVTTPTVAVNAVIPITSLTAHSHISVSSGQLVIAQGYWGALMAGLYLEPITASNAVTLDFQWYDNGEAAYIGCRGKLVSNTSTNTAYLRIPTAMALVDARSAAKTISLRIAAHSGTTSLRLVGVRVDYLGDSWVSAISVLE